MTRLIEARRRYAALRAGLAPDCPRDRELYSELTETIRALDRKIAAGGGDDLTPGGQSAAGPEPARHHHSAR